MDGYAAALGGALWLGVLTSISPCPLATNIAAISYTGRGAAKPGRALLAGALYTLGRMAVYIALASVIALALTSVPQMANFLQKHMNKILGPVLLASGILMTGIAPLPSFGSGAGEGLKKRVDAMGVFGALFLGVLFALTFCPVSAGLFFGSLAPLCVKYRSIVVMPSLYGIGTAVPVIFFTVLIAGGSQALSGYYDKVTRLERPARIATGFVFMLVGIYYIIQYNFGISLW